MQNNSNDSVQGWRQRLDEFEDISGNGLDLNTAWEKLQQKKSVYPTSSAKKWYWLAAASIMVMLVTLTGILTNRPPGKSDPEFAKTAPQKAEKENNNFVIQNTPAVTAEKQPEGTVKIENKPAVLLKTKDAVAPEPLLVKEAINETSFAIHSPDTIAIQPLPVATVAVKKLKVVHINELNQPQQGIAKEEGKPYFPITYQTREVYTNADDNNKKGRDNLIRIKLN